ncbi:MAG: methyltransferase domain-containing protein, partial [Verrucomicrobiae bacterium]|nr:methyltransferase domain-containing protein [Verrucomicrobiae bacterium]
AAMDCRGVFLGKKLADALTDDLAGRKRVLDIGGGSGVYVSALVANVPRLAGIVLEQEPVDRVAREKIAARGLADRVKVVTGDMFTCAYPEDCDVHLFSNVMHDWDIPEIEKLLVHSHAALEDGGLIVVHETFLNPEKTGPLPVAEYSCILVHSTRGRCYSWAEMAACLEAAGFVEPRFFETAGDRGAVVARKP